MKSSRERVHGKGVNRIVTGVILIIGVISSCSICRAETEPQESKEDAAFSMGAIVARSGTNSPAFLLPLRATHIESQIHPGTLLTTVSQTFTNDTSLTLEAVYMFPLPSRATITDMTMIVGDRRIRSVVQERKQAVKTYEKAKSEGRRASLVTQERPNIFTTSLANLLPGDQITVELSFFEPTEYDNGSYNVTIPLVVGERYIPAELAPHPSGDGMVLRPAIEDANAISGPTISPKSANPHKVTFLFSTHGLPIEEITSVTHAIDVKRDTQSDEKWEITPARGRINADCDIALKLKLRNQTDPCPIAVIVPTEDDGMYGLLSLFPPPKDKVQKKVLPREVIFVVDTSGSMNGDSINQAKAGLQECLKSLRPDDAFTIVRFANDTSALTPTARPATEEFIKTAGQYISGLSADGGTEMGSALDYVFSMPLIDGGRLPIVILLTDACVGNDNELIQKVADNLGRRRLFTIGIGSASNDYLIRRAAELGRGQACFIRSNEEIHTEIVNMFATLDAPIVTDISLEWHDVSDGLRKPAVYPPVSPDLFAGRPVQVLFHLEGKFDGEVIMKGKFGNAPFEKRIAMHHIPTAQTLAASRIIPKLFARKQIDDLLFRMSNNSDSAKYKELHEELLSVALKQQLICRYTARVAVEEHIEKSPDGSLTTVEVPRDVPRGWNGFGSTASLDYTFLSVSALCAMAALFFAFKSITLQRKNDLQ